MGIDWGEATNAYAVIGYKGKVLEQGSVPETPDGSVNAPRRAAPLRPPRDGQLPPVAIETPRRLSCRHCATADVSVVPLNPKSVKAARGIKTVRNASKTDPKDASSSPTCFATTRTTTTRCTPQREAAAITLLFVPARGCPSALRQAARVRSRPGRVPPQRGRCVQRRGHGRQPRRVLGASTRSRQRRARDCVLTGSPRG